ncbi:preprotein translocase subunit SecE [Ureibacillus sp. FSL K6-8385]|uniref:Protein translocase subunit SecE n=1 Tax=Ureibacillus terrenus TaxID=118246 RepID=A0A540V2P6_9BACL|nr:preprotein translocase subunit SecE [Ureibacillus terrenus]MED3661689.1 preprotein translocase subunit SecE [Ureibacillus terrenus]MED3763529.1 preprotein translocase subunit SecE [Ureibacillus terrenus]TQE91019.1 preprotein translocase subunit SecE [Ureibacillus terrenus]
MGKIKQFLHEVMSEMRKTSWPKSKELTKYTIVVITTVIFFALFFVLVDLGISEAIRWYLDL